MIKLATLIALVYVIRTESPWAQQRELCPTTFDKFKDVWKALPENVKKSWQKPQELTAGNPIAAGMNGETFVVETNDFKYLIKKMNMEDDILKQAYLENELSAMEVLGPSEVAPKIMACFTEVKEMNQITNIYLAMDYYEGPAISNEDFLKKVVDLKVQAMSLWLQLIDAIDIMAVNKIVHSDLKLDNIIVIPEKNISPKKINSQTSPSIDKAKYSKEDFTVNSQLKLIDFGCASERGRERSGMLGTPYFISPNKMGSVTVDIMEDVYAWVITIMMAHASEKEKDNDSNVKFDQEFSAKKLFYWKGADDQEPRHIVKRCFLIHRTEICQKQITENAKVVLKDAGYGEYKPRQQGQDYETFTSLFIDILEYESPVTSLDVVIKQLQILVTKHNKNKQPDQQINWTSKSGDSKRNPDKTFTPFETQKINGEPLSNDQISDLLANINIFDLSSGGNQSQETFYHAQDQNEPEHFTGTIPSDTGVQNWGVSTGTTLTYSQSTIAENEKAQNSQTNDSDEFLETI